MFSCFQLTVPLPNGDAPLLDDISFEIEDGEWAEIVGPSGSGKSVLYALMALEARPPYGRLVVAGRNLDRVDRAGYAELRRTFGTCRQTPQLLEGRSALENVVLPLVVRGASGRAGEEGERMLEEADLSDRRDVVARDLSDGERRLLGILRAAVGAPEAVLVDGAFSELDGTLRTAAVQVLEEAHGRGSTVVLFGRESSGAGPDGSVRFRLEGGSIERVEG